MKEQGVLAGDGETRPGLGTTGDFAGEVTGRATGEDCAWVLRRPRGEEGARGLRGPGSPGEGGERDGGGTATAPKRSKWGVYF